MQSIIVSKGTLTGSLAHPREVFQGAIRHAAAGVILMHNHPSGDPQPSSEDCSVTARLKGAGEILGDPGSVPVGTGASSPGRSAAPPRVEEDKNPRPGGALANHRKEGA